MSKNLESFVQTYGGISNHLTDSLGYATLTATTYNNAATISLNPAYEEKLQEISDAVKDLIILSSNSSVNERIDKIEKSITSQDATIKEIADALRKLSHIKESSNGQACRQDCQVKRPPDDFL